tara:strand:- start:1854 stop:3728 length:1875 start_codon:yes stop_codon:yes gene_type:complete
MAIIYTYPVKSTPVGADLLLISDSVDDKTKQITISSVKDTIDVVDSLIAGSGISISSATGDVTIANTGVLSLTSNFGTYISGTNNASATGVTSIGTVDLNAIDGTAVAATKFLSKDNTWDTPPSYTGGSNLGYVPTGGSVGKYLDGTGAWVTASGSGTVTGSGTVNKLTKWSTGGTGIEDSIMTEEAAAGQFSGSYVSVTAAGGGLSTQRLEINKSLIDGAGSAGVDGYILSSTTVTGDKEVAWIANTALAAASPPTGIQFNTGGSLDATAELVYVESGSGRIIEIGGGTQASHGALDVVSEGPSETPTAGYIGFNNSTKAYKLKLEATPTASYNITLPSAGPSGANKILESNASGALSWISTPSGSGGVTSFTNANGTFISAATVNTSATGSVTTGSIDLSATGTPSSSSFLRGDNTWAVPPGLSPTNNLSLIRTGVFETTLTNTVSYSRFLMGNSTTFQQVNFNPASTSGATNNVIVGLQRPTTATNYLRIKTQLSIAADSASAAKVHFAWHHVNGSTTNPTYGWQTVGLDDDTTNDFCVINFTTDILVSDLLKLDGNEAAAGNTIYLWLKATASNSDEEIAIGRYWPSTMSSSSNYSAGPLIVEVYELTSGIRPVNAPSPE